LSPTGTLSHHKTQALSQLIFQSTTNQSRTTATNQKKAKASGRNLRSAVETTVRSLKHPFGNGKLPVRGKVRVSKMMIASAAMTNARRIWRYQTLQNASENAQKLVENSFKQALYFTIWAFLFPFFQLFTTRTQYSSVVV
jgi:hypothetical protein